MDTIAKLAQRKPTSFHQYVTKIRELGTDNLSHFGNGYLLEGGYSLQQHPEEFAALIVFLDQWFAGELGLNFLEIGTASGGTMRLLNEETGLDHLWSIDDGKHPRFSEQARNFREIPIVHQYVGDSHGAAPAAWLSSQDTLFNVALIDGDHSYEGVWQDIQMVRPFLPFGSLVVFHDIVAVQGVRRAWLRGGDRMSDSDGLWVPLAEYIGSEKPLGIGVGLVL